MAGTISIDARIHVLCECCGANLKFVSKHTDEIEVTPCDDCLNGSWDDGKQVGEDECENS
jgi:hypothetical protein